MDTIQESGSKRKRLSWQQRLLLEKVFVTNAYPDQQLRIRLSKEVGMSPRKVQIWFQNRRTKAKNEVEESPFLFMAEIQDVNMVIDSMGNTLLHVVCGSGHACLQHLLARGARVNSVNKKGVTPLYLAVLHNRHDVVDLLLSKRFNCDINASDLVFGQTPLHLCALKGLDDLSLILVSKGTQVDVAARDNGGRTALHHAAIYGYWRIARQLINSRCPVNGTTKEGNTALHCACLNGQLEVVKLLLENGADINIKDNFGYTALHFAVREQHEDIVEVLLDKGALPNIQTNQGYTALHIATMRPSFSILRMVADRSDVTIKSAGNFTAMHFACYYRFLYHESYLKKIEENKK